MKYSPPGYLTFERLFKKVYSQYFDDKGSLRQLVNGEAIYDLDDDNQEEIEKIIKNPAEAVKHSFILHKIDIRPSVEAEIIHLMCTELNDDQYVFSPRSGKDWIFSTDLLKQFVHITKTLKIIRDTLCSTIKTENDEPFSFIEHNGQKSSIPNDMWINGGNWYGLIYDSKLPSDCAVTSIYPDEPAREIVYFNEKLVDKILTENAAIPLDKITSNFVQKITEGEITFRPAEIFYQLVKILHPTSFVFNGTSHQITSTSATNFERFLEKLAKDRGFEIATPQKSGATYNLEKSLSSADIKSISRLLRSLKQQEK